MIGLNVKEKWDSPETKNNSIKSKNGSEFWKKNKNLKFLSTLPVILSNSVCLK
jgi:hypothetical protein